jgi:hypothetical protein
MPHIAYRCSTRFVVFTTTFVFFTMSPTVEPMLRATSVNRSPLTAIADDAADAAADAAEVAAPTTSDAASDEAVGFTARLRLFFVAGRLVFFLAVPLFFSSGIHHSPTLPRSIRQRSAKS